MTEAKNKIEQINIMYKYKCPYITNRDALVKDVYIPGKIKMKKALIPPMTLMTSLMSGTNMAMRRVTVIQITVRTILQRLSSE